MQISYDTVTGLVRQTGESLGDLDGCAITDIPDEEAVHLSEDGTKSYDSATGLITVVPPDTTAEDAAKAAADQAATQRLADAETIMAVLPTQEAKDAMKRLLGIE